MSGYRDNWESWMTRIPKEDSEFLLKWGKNYVKNGRIPKADKYNISRLALKTMIQSIKKQIEIAESNRAKA